MLRYIYSNDLDQFPKLSESMFKDRTLQFRDRLKWDVTVNADGLERDEYDDLNPLYVIWEQEDGTHGGSMRFLPTTGPTMAKDHFSHLYGNEDIVSPFIWECTRFCLSPNGSAKVPAALMLGGGELMRAFSLSHFLGIFDERMVRIYRLIGSSPDVLGSVGVGRDRISLGLWSFTEKARQKLIKRSAISSGTSEQWFDQSFGAFPELHLAKTA